MIRQACGSVLVLVICCSSLSVSEAVQRQSGTTGKGEKSTAAKQTSKIRNPFPGRVKAPEGILDGGAEWLNSSGEITLKDLRGKIVILDFWTYCCINCMHVLPDLKFLEKKYPNELVVIGVHSAKFTNEKESDNIRQAIMRYEIEHPVVNDRDMVIWRKFGTNAWPTLAIVDPEGYYLGSQSGEGNKELIDTIVARLVKYHKAKGTLDLTPTTFALEREKVIHGPLRYPGKVLADPEGGRVFVADTGHNRIVVAGEDGKLIDVIGNGAIGLRDGSYTEAEFDHPQGMTLVGNSLYVADTENHVVRVVDLTKKTVGTLAGTGRQARQRVMGGALRTTALNSPWALQHLDGILFVAMAGPHQLWQHEIGSDEISVYAGSGAEDVTNGPLKSAALAQPSGLVTDGGFLYVVDSEGSAVRKVSTSDDGTISTIAGTSDLPNGRSLFEFGDRDGRGKHARLQHPLGIAINGDTLYIADSYNHRIKKIDIRSSTVSSWLGDGKPGKALDPVRFSEPGGLSFDGKSLLVADTNNHRICRVDPSTSKTVVLKLEGLKPPTPPRQKKAQATDVVDLPQMKFKPTDRLPVQFSLGVPDGYKINKLMPVTWRIENAANSPAKLVTAGAESSTGTRKGVTGSLRVSVPIDKAVRQGVLLISVRYGFCRDGEGGLCKIRDKTWRVPLVADPAAAGIKLEAK